MNRETERCENFLKSLESDDIPLVFQRSEGIPMIISLFLNIYEVNVFHCSYFCSKCVKELDLIFTKVCEIN